MAKEIRIPIEEAEDCINDVLKMEREGLDPAMEVKMIAAYQGHGEPVGVKLDEEAPPNADEKPDVEQSPDADAEVRPVADEKPNAESSFDANVKARPDVDVKPRHSTDRSSQENCEQDGVTVERQDISDLVRSHFGSSHFLFERARCFPVHELS